MQAQMMMYLVPVLLMFISVPLILKKIPKNRFYGLRTRKTMSGSEEYWYRANQSAGFGMFLAGVVSFLAGLLIQMFVANEKMALRVWSFVLIVSVLAAFGFSMMKDAKSAE